MNQQDLYMESFLPEDFYKTIESGAFVHQLFPPFSDREAWEKIKRKENRTSLVADLMAEAEKIRTLPPQRLLLSGYCEFAVNGNRSRYERGYFGRRNRMGTLVLALCLSGDRERWLMPVLDYLTAILEERSWCMPAHAVWNGTLPGPNCQSDLFASETGAQIGLAVNLLGELFDEVWPGFSDRLREETLSRTVRNVLNPVTRPLNHWFDAEKPNNWTPWCCYNILLTAVCLERDPRELARIIRIFLRPVSRFASLYSDDGYCEEGSSYYNKAGGMLFKTTALLEKIVPSSMKSFYADPKNRAIFEFIAKVRIGGEQLAYADGSPRAPQLSIVVPCGAAIHSSALTAFGRGKTLSIQRWCGDELAETLTALFDYPDRISGDPEDLPPVSFFPDRLAILRTSGFSAALKAGYNAEPHNHNDLGQFFLYRGKTPVIVDAGCGTYSKRNFSSERYTLWYTRGSGHNAPVFGSVEQQEGNGFRARLPEPRKRKNSWILSCDLSDAYPPEAGVQMLTRTMDFSPDKVVVEDSIRRSGEAGKKEIFLNLMTPETPVADGNTIRLGGVLLSLEEIEFVSCRKLPVLADKNNPDFGRFSLTRILLKTRSDHYRLIFTPVKK